MKFKSIEIDLPSDILLTLNETEHDLINSVKSSFAIQLYQEQKVTIGKAAQIAEMSKYKFELLLSEKKILISNLSLVDLLNDSTKIR